MTKFEPRSPANAASSPLGHKPASTAFKKTLVKKGKSPQIITCNLFTNVIQTNTHTDRYGMHTCIHTYDNYFYK